MPNATRTIASHHQVLDTAAGCLVYLWRRVDRLSDLPLTDFDRNEVLLQKMLIKAYILFLSEMKDLDTAPPPSDRMIIDDIMSFTSEANQALDDAGIDL